MYFDLASDQVSSGGAKQDRTADLLRARQALSQLSYSPLTRLFCLSNKNFGVIFI